MVLMVTWLISDGCYVHGCVVFVDATGLRRRFTKLMQRAESGVNVPKLYFGKS